MTNYAALEEIISIEVDVTEKIAEDNIKKFAFSSLSLNNKNFSNNDLIYINYIKQLKQYQIILINNNYKYLPFQIFEQFYNKQTKGFDLYLCDNFFCLYKDGLFYYYQKIQLTLSMEDFLDFIQRKFNAEINTYIKIEKDYLDELKNKYLQNNKSTTLKNINIKKNNDFKFYLLYIILLFFASFYYYYNEKNILKDINNELIKTDNIESEKIKNKYLFVGIENDFKNILKNIKLNNLEILFFEYKKNKIKISLSSNTKRNLYLFLKTYKKQLISSSVNFNEDENNYEMIAYVKLSK